MMGEKIDALPGQLVHPERHFVTPIVREVAAFHVSKLAPVMRLQSLPDNVFMKGEGPDETEPNTDALEAA